MSAQARQKARDPARSALVQAPAGSGKTELLTQRILALLAAVDEPEEILALTFTRKAAAEMRTRLIEALSMAEPDSSEAHKRETWGLAQAALKRSEQRGWNLAEHASRLRLMTLDSFTHMLAAQLPLLSGLGEMPAAGDEPVALYRESAEVALDLLLKSDPLRARALLLHFDHQAVTLIELVAQMLAKREQWLPIVATHARDMDGLREQLQAMLAELVAEQLQLCMDLTPPDYRHALPPLLAYAGRNRQVPELAALTVWPKATVDALPLWQMIADELMTDKGMRKPGGINARRGFPAGREGAEQKRAFQQIVADLDQIPDFVEAWMALRRLPPLAVYSDSQWQQMESLFALLILASGELQKQFTNSGETDFTEIALRALQALEGDGGAPSDLLLRLDYRIHHILVDEFQDTSLLQMRLLQNLTAGWQAGDGRHRTLFMVGDPMQSIYRFRKAEVGLFLQAAANAAGLPEVEFLQLERNFRSSPEIVEWVNRAFAAIFPQRQDAVRGAVKHARARAALDHDGEITLRLQQLDESRNRVDDGLEAAAVVRLIRSELDCNRDCNRNPNGEEQSRGGDDKPPSIAVLARSRKHLHAIMRALHEAGIAFRATKLQPLQSCSEVRLLRTLMRALLHQGDRASWAALLHSPCGGLDTVDMFRLLRSSDQSLWPLLHDRDRLRQLSDQGRRRAQLLVKALAPCVGQAGRITVRELLYSAWHRLGLDRFYRNEAADNIEVALELIGELEEGGGIDFDLFDARLEKRYGAPDTSPEAAQVELMTMHGAKGLQWDVVILPGLGKRGNNSDTPLLAFTDLPVAGVEQPLLAMRAATRGEDRLFALVNGIEKSKFDYELARLLYVACTRARRALHLFGHISRKGEAVSCSLLALLLPDGVEGGCFGADLLPPDDSEQKGDGSDIECRKPLLRMRELPQMPEADKPVESAERAYVWAGPGAAPIGNVVHAALQRLGEQGVETLNRVGQPALPDAEQLRLRRALQAEGVAGDLLEEAFKRTNKALLQTLASERGRWILSNSHHDAHCEWEISTVRDGYVQHHVIDRSFVDSDGYRWIIDYKTASHQGGDPNTFLAEELKRHTAQLERYAAVLSRLEPERPIRCALYFPMLDGWCELE